MKFTRDNLRLYAITDRSWLNGRTLYEDVESALKGGVTMIQLREKELDFDAFLAVAQQLKPLCQQYNVPFIINDNIDVAIACDADGVHVGQSDLSVAAARQRLGEDKIVGATAKTIEQAQRAQASGADYLGSGAVFGTTTKLDALPMNLELFQQICGAVKIPVCAIGGITKDNLSGLKGRGLSGVALVSTVFAASDIQAECQELSTMLKEMLEK